MSAGLLHMKVILSKFASLIEKDRGIRPCEVLATCAYKVPTFYPVFMGKISESHFLGFFSMQALLIYIKPSTGDRQWPIQGYTVV